MLMASAIAAATFVCSPASAPSGTKSAILRLKTPKFHLCSVSPPLGLTPFSPWSGLKHLGISFIPKYLKFERNGRCKGMVVYASLFGVGAPEALVIGVVALLVFGPKGLAEVARTLGKTLRAFQPTIRELQDVSRDFKSTLEKEIGLDDLSGSSIDAYNAKKMDDTTSTPSPPSSLDDISSSSIDAYNARKMADTSSTASSTSSLDDISSSSIDAYNAQKMADTASTSSSTSTSEDSETTADPNGAPSPKAYTSEEYLKITEEQLKAVAQKQVQTSAPVESQLEAQTPTQATVEETATRTPAAQQPQSET